MRTGVLLVSLLVAAAGCIALCPAARARQQVADAAPGAADQAGLIAHDGAGRDGDNGNDEGVMRCIRLREQPRWRHRPPGARSAPEPAPESRSVGERSAQHAAYWPGARELTITLGRWLHEERFDCLQQTYDDLKAAGARFPDGEAKIAAFSDAADLLVQHRQGMTPTQISEYLGRWRGGALAESPLPNLIGPRLLSAGAWRLRGFGPNKSIPEARLQTFRGEHRRAMEALMSSEPALRDELLWHFIAARIVADEEPAAEALAALSLDSLRRFPEDFQVALYPARQMLESSGSSATQLEGYARAALEATKARSGYRAYAFVYSSALVYSSGVPMLLLRESTSVNASDLRQGFIELSRSASWRYIRSLQSYACAWRDAEALELSRSLWQQYEREPQLVPADRALTPLCRMWIEQTPGLQ